MSKLRWLLLGLIAGCVMGLSVTTPLSHAQFATNTPSGDTAPPATPLNPTAVPPAATPLPPAPTVPTPDAPLENYALRLWLEQNLIDVLFTQIAALQDGGGIDVQRAVALTTYELRQRFPNAPSNPATLEQLVRAMLNAPRGTIDMRWVVQPYIAAELNERQTETNFEFNNFRVDLTPTKLNNDEVEDYVVHILYPADADSEEEVLYEEYTLATRRADDTFTLLPTNYESPVAPYGNIRSVSLQRVEDVNQDTLHEMVLVVDDGSVSPRWWIIGVRGDRAVDLVEAGQQIRVGEIVSWQAPADGLLPILRVNEYRSDSVAPNWICTSEMPVRWEYSANYYRRMVGLNVDFVPQDSLGCTLWQAEPLFEKDPAEASKLVENAIIEYSLDAPSADRALVTLGVLYALEGRFDEARAAAQAALARAEADSWSAQQSQALLSVLENTLSSRMLLCEALTSASPEPACDVAAVLGRELQQATFKTDVDLVEQLETAGLPVIESVLVKEIGKLDRVVVSFNFTNAGWWGFAAQRDGTYRVEPADPPTGFEVASAPEALTDAPIGAYEALLLDDSPENVLNILETTARSTPDVPLSAAARYLQALAYDLTSNRTAARRAYYELWSTFPRSLWGQLAREHLERR